jgi:outer membrane protein assembly factor BamC
MKIRNIAGLILAVLALASCSFDKQRVDYKVAASEVPTLEIPPDLTTPSSNDQYAIPGGDGALAANYSDYAKGIAGKPAQNAVLPERKNVHLERNGMQRWLVVDKKAEDVWPIVKTFWLEMGFDIKVNNPQSGVMETGWQENKGNVPQHFMRGILGNGKILDTLKPAGQRDQYLSRLERSKDGLSTEIYLTQQVMEEMQVLGKKESKWLPHANSPEIEAAVLQMLMAKLGAETDALSPPAPASTVAAPAMLATTASVQLIDIAGNKVIQLSESFDKSWRKVGLALDKARIAVEDKDRTKGIFLLRAAATAKGKKAEGYQVTVREHDSLCEVSARHANGESDKESLRIIEALFQNIEK